MTAFNYTPSSFLDMTFFTGAILVQRKLMELDGGGITVNNKTFVIDTLLFNRFAYNGSDAEFATYLVAHPHKPLFISTPISTSATTENLFLSIARECSRLSACVMNIPSAAKRVFECTLPDMDAPECIGRLGKRRLINVVSLIPNSDSLPESFIGYMAFKQQRTMAVIGGDGVFVTSAMTMAPRIAETYGITQLFSRYQSSQTCNQGNISELVSNLQRANPDFIVAIASTTGGAPACFASILRYMKEVDYLPKALSFMGGLFEGVQGTLGADANDLMVYLYNTVALNIDAFGYAYNAQSSASHTELFPSTDNQTSGQVYAQSYQNLFGMARYNSPIFLYSLFGAGSTITLLHLLEVSSGVLDPVLWQTTIQQINYPSILGNIEFDGTGRMQGLRLQLMMQKRLNPATNTYDSPIVSTISRYQDTFPAPLWSTREFRTYFEESDGLRAVVNPQYAVLAATVLFFGTWSGMFGLNQAVRDSSSVFSSGSGIFKMCISTSLSFGLAGHWAFFITVFQGVSFEPTNPKVLQTIHPQIPIAPCFLSILTISIVPLASYLYIRIHKKIRSCIKHVNTHDPSSAPSSTTGGSSGQSTVTIGRSSMYSHEIDEEEEEEQEEDNRDEKKSPKIHPSPENALSSHGTGPVAVSPHKGTITGFFNVARVVWKRKKILYALLLLDSCLWILSPFLIQYVILQSYSVTNVVPTLDGAVWIGYFMIGQVLMSLAFSTYGLLFQSDVVCASLQSLASIIIFLASTLQTNFQYHTTTLDNNNAVATLDQTVGVLIGGLIGLLISIVSVSIMLRKAGADNIHIIREKRLIMRQRNRAKNALVASMKQTVRLQRQVDTIQLIQSFIHGQKILMNYPTETSSDPMMQITYKSALVRLQRRYETNLRRIVQQRDSIIQSSLAVGDEEVNVFIKTFDKKHVQERLVHASVVASAGNMSLHNLASNPLSNEWARYALKVGFSEENLYFWWCTKFYDTLHDERDKQDEAQFIFDTFITPNAPMQINIPASDVKDIEKWLATTDAFPPDLFEKAKKQVEQLFATNNASCLRNNPAFVNSFDDMVKLVL